MLGLAVPVTASYIIAAVMVAPALVQSGVPVAAAHMFIFYYAVLSEVSPPTALSPFAAAAITGGNPFRTMMLTWKYTLPAFVVPFVFTLSPAGRRSAAAGPLGHRLDDGDRGAGGRALAAASAAGSPARASPSNAPLVAGGCCCFAPRRRPTWLVLLALWRRPDAGAAPGAYQAENLHRKVAPRSGCCARGTFAIDAIGRWARRFRCGSRRGAACPALGLPDTAATSFATPRPAPVGRSRASSDAFLRRLTIGHVRIHRPSGTLPTPPLNAARAPTLDTDPPGDRPPGTRRIPHPVHHASAARGSRVLQSAVLRCRRSTCDVGPCSLLSFRRDA